MHPLEEFAELLARLWREEAEVFRRRALDQLAAMTESFATSTLQAAAEHLDQPLTLREACETCGLSYSTLESQVREGRIPNAGEKGRPRVRRRDLPWKGNLSNTPPTLLVLNEVESLGRDEDPASALIEEELLTLEREDHEPDLD